VLGDARGAEQLGEGAGVVGPEREGGRALVGVFLRVHEHVAPPGAVHEHAQAVALLGGEVVAEPQARQLGLVDVGHGPPLVGCGFTRFSAV
jgi:hypothetical protein